MAEKVPVHKELMLLREQLDEANKSLCGKRPDDHILHIMTQVVRVKNRERVVRETAESLEKRFQTLFRNQCTAINEAYDKERSKQGHLKSSSLIFSMVFSSMLGIVYLYTQTQANDKKFVEAVGVKFEQVLEKSYGKGSTGKSMASTMYDWGAWACSPLKKLKFW